MASGAAAPEKFALARLTVIPANKSERPRRHVRLAMSQRLYWMVVNPDKDPAPTSLYDFTNQSSLSLKRLPSTATWKDVADKVAPRGEDGLSFIIPGRLHGSAQKNILAKLTASDDHEDWVVLTANTTAERNRWMHEIRLRISPPQVLQELAEKVFVDDTSTAASGTHLIEEMKSLFIGDIAGQHVDELKEAPSELVDEVSSASSCVADVANRINTSAPKVDWIEKINVQLKTWTDFVASAVKKGAGTAEIVANTGQDVADFAKFIPGGVSAVFQLVALSARFVVMFAEAGRGCRELPDILTKVMDLLDCVAGSFAPILNPITTLVEIKKILEGNLFDALVATFDLVWKIEEQLMRPNWSRVINSSVMKEIEDELTALKQMVVDVALTEQMKVIEYEVLDNKLKVVSVKEGLDKVKYDVGKVKKEVKEDLDAVKHDVGKVKKDVEESLDEVRYDVGRAKEGLDEITHDFGEVKKVVKEDLDEVRHDVNKKTVLRKMWVFTILALLLAMTLAPTKNLELKPADFLSTGLLPRPNPSPFFVGREKELDLLKNAAEEYGSAAITGLGGVGKTQLMAAFAERVESNGEVPGGVFWISADGNASDIIESLAIFAEKMHGQRMRNEDRVKRDVVVHTIQKWLDKVNGRWLLCVDNVDYAGKPDVNVILGALTSMGWMRGWVIVTSRVGNLKLWTRMKQGQNIVLNPLSTEDAMCMLLRLKGTNTTDDVNDDMIGEESRRLETNNLKEFEALRELAQCLSGLPLAVAQAGAFISSQDCSFSEYLLLYRSASKKSEFDFVLRRTEEELSPVREEQRGIFTTWKISVGRLSAEAASMLQAVAMFGNAPIPGNLLKRVFKEVDEESDAPEIRFSKVMHEELVYGSSLMQRIRGAGEDSFDTHKLVRLFVLVGLEQSTSQPWEIVLTKMIKGTHSHVGDVLDQAGKGFYDEPDGHGDRQLDLLPHTLSIMHHREKRGCISVERESVDLSLFTGICLRWKGRFSEAEAVYDSLLKMQYAVHGRGVRNEVIASSQHRLGIVYQLQGKLDQAERMYEESLTILLALHGLDTPHPNVAASYHQLGLVYEAQGRLDEAKKMCEESLEMHLFIYGSNAHREVAASYHLLGKVYQRQGRLDQAEKMYYLSLEMKLTIYKAGTPHPSVAATYYRLASVYLDQGKLDQAENMSTSSLKMNLNVYGSDTPHPSTAESLRQLGRVYQDQGKLAKAKSMYYLCLQMKVDIYWFLTPAEYNFEQRLEKLEIARSYHELRTVYLRQGKMDQTEKMYDLSVDEKLALYGPSTSHPWIGSTLSDFDVHFVGQSIDLAVANYKWKCSEQGTSNLTCRFQY